MGTEDKTQKQLLQEILDTLKGRASGTGSPGPATAPAATGDSDGMSQAAIDARTARDELEKYNIALDEHEAALKLVEKQYSGLSQGITSKYAIQAAEATVNHTEALRRNADQFKKGEKTLDEYRKKQRKINKGFAEANEQLTGQKGMSENLTRVATSMTGLNLKSGSLTEKMVNLGNQLREGASGGGKMGIAFKDMAGSMMKGGVLKAIELVSAGFKAFAKLTTDFLLGQDKAVSAFRQATGAGKEYNLQIAAVSVASRKAGITAADQGKAFTELYTSMSSFTELNKGEQNNLVETTNLLGKMGVAAGDQSKILDQMTRTLGKSSQGALNVLLDLAGSAQSIGVPVGKMTKDFAAAFGELSKFGDSAIDVFKDLSVQSKKTGIEVSRLMAITKKFDTFEGAATAVGKLNAILGGPYLNSIDMLNASESERIEQIRTTLQLSGQQFEALNRFEKMAIADALGMSVEETGRLMKMSTAEMQMQALEAAEVAEQAAAMQDIMTRIKAEFSALALDLYPVFQDVIGPGIEKFSTFISAFAKVTSGLSAWKATFLTVSSILMGMVLPLAALAAVFGGPVGWGIAAALIGGTLLGGGMAASAVTDTYDEVESERAANKAKRTGKKKGMSDGGLVGDIYSTYRDNDFMNTMFGSRPQSPGNRVNMNEFGKEGAILPDGTYVATATDMKDSIAASQLVARELAGLRADIQAAAGRPVHLMVEDGREFASHIVDNSGMSPFLVG